MWRKPLNGVSEYFTFLSDNIHFRHCRFFIFFFILYVVSTNVEHFVCLRWDYISYKEVRVKVAQIRHGSGGGFCRWTMKHLGDKNSSDILCSILSGTPRLSGGNGLRDYLYDDSSISVGVSFMRRSHSQNRCVNGRRPQSPSIELSMDGCDW